MKITSKLSTYKFKHKLKYQDMSKSLDVSSQTVKNWCGTGKKLISRIRLEHAQRLVDYTNNYITLEDCGHYDKVGNN